jgi:hypothetical protein
MNRGTKAAIGAGAILAVAGIVTVLFLRYRNREEAADGENPYGYDAVDLYIEESFPASDAPSYSLISHIGGLR